LVGSGDRCSRLEEEVDLVGWAPAGRAQLASVAAQGLAVVHLEVTGCRATLEVLPRCTSGKASYGYTASDESQSRISHDAGSLQASFPLGPVDLSGKLSGNRSVRADYRLAGVHRIPVGTRFALPDLVGDCSRATHVVSAIYRGAFALASGLTAAIGASASLLSTEVDRSVEMLDRAGRVEACTGSDAPAAGCDVPLRIEVTPLESTGRAGQQLPPQREDRPWFLDRRPKLDWSGPGSCPAGMVEIPGGTFTMGDARGQRPEQPPHSRVVAPFCLDRTEVTVADYARCVEAGHCPDLFSQQGHCNGPGRGRDRHPMNCIDPDRAAEYCTWLGKRLPLEAEWEFAARGGSAQHTYPWGNLDPGPGTACFKRPRHLAGTCPVGSYPAEAFGLHDLGGNVREHVLGGFVPYPGAQGSYFSARLPVLRGGSWFEDDARNLRSTRRSTDSTSSFTAGLRCAYPLDEASDGG
jgi:hypothetical protein